MHDLGDIRPSVLLPRYDAVGDEAGYGLDHVVLYAEVGVVGE